MCFSFNQIYLFVFNPVSGESEPRSIFVGDGGAALLALALVMLKERPLKRCHGRRVFFCRQTCSSAALD